MNSPNTHGELIVFRGGGYAFIDGVPDTCDHDYSDSVYQTKSGKWIYWHTYREWASLTSKARDELIMRLHGPGGEFEEDPILLGTSQCTKCKKIYSPPMF